MALSLPEPACQWWHPYTGAAYDGAAHDGIAQDGAAHDDAAHDGAAHATALVKISSSIPTEGDLQILLWRRPWGKKSQVLGSLEKNLTAPREG